MTDEEKKKDQIEKKIIIEDQKNSMEEKEQKSKKSDSLEDKSLEELHKQIEKGKRKASRSFVFAVAAIIAIIAIGVAWFVVNTKVSAIGARISADNPVSFELGSAGQRSSAETKYLVDDNKNNVRNAGEEKNFSCYIDARTGEQVASSVSLYTGTSNLAWHLKNGNLSLSPGASGKFEFYIIPKMENLTEATVTIDLKAYEMSNGIVEAVEDDKVQSLLEGHVLLFLGLSQEKGYTGWIEKSDKLTVTPSNITCSSKSDGNSQNESFQVNVPYKVTLYWVWPKYFRNYLYNSSSNGDLFTDINNNDDYNRMLDFVKKQIDMDNSKLFYKQPNDSTSVPESMSNPEEMRDSELDLWSNYYNQADEYIGKLEESDNEDSVKRYIYIEATVE